ncbi:hypothetical protein SDC9_135156 [bioreactor metagenome]|uniref:Uncharacterized protein n=1 Tax=bioreactor metagenome TaxID=1076179 RepID=A0A645DFQ6_9ZZZZ
MVWSLQHGCGHKANVHLAARIPVSCRHRDLLLDGACLVAFTTGAIGGMHPRHTVCPYESRGSASG